MLINVYLISINIISFILMGIDKYKAIRKKYRISEKSFIILGILMGSLGIFIGMIIFHHKTRHILFNTFIPLMLMIEIFLFIYM